MRLREPEGPTAYTLIFALCRGCGELPASAITLITGEADAMGDEIDLVAPPPETAISEVVVDLNGELTTDCFGVAILFCTP